MQMNVDVAARDVNVTNFIAASSTFCLESSPSHPNATASSMSQRPPRVASRSVSFQHLIISAVSVVRLVSSAFSSRLVMPCRRLLALFVGTPASIAYSLFPPIGGRCINQRGSQEMHCPHQQDTGGRVHPQNMEFGQNWQPSPVDLKLMIDQLE